ncbi:CRAL/TRIO domain protein [Metarhizium album ARSEF 1941]|uniref:CRAL/TRIO domain protein n=1 Tax=Metarhizium album (strain ARSEF 1941) TaxID=1081103 RepID=A0A0B2X5U7_METAS|nr:CRAL/TRIO domain protein [Metarhizium album ARSEF 1941]KHO01143.1 CRAL/TRIO domain protein [Metarhizium album ARSEF 1941]
MADKIAPGHLENLTAEQEDKLRQLWDAVLKVCGVSDAKDVDAVPASDGKLTSDAQVDKKKRGFGFFRGAPQQPAAASSGGTNTTTDSAHEDKYGLTKQYQEILATQKPEEIRETMWAMMKQDHPDALLLRFLRARKWHVEKALVMLISSMNWRYTKMKVDQDIMKNGEAGAAADEKAGDAHAKKLGHDFLKQARMGKSFLHGTDKEGRPICVVRVRLHKAADQSPESLERYTVFLIETARLTLKPPVDTAASCNLPRRQVTQPANISNQNIIFDMTGFALANMDYHPVKFMIQCFEANYPESLGVVLVHNAPWLFQGIWKIIRGWLDPVVAAKVHFTNHRAGLEQYIHPSQLIKDLDGDEDWKLEFEEPIEGENDLMKDTKTRDRLLGEREALYAQYEAATRRWITHATGEEAEADKAERNQIATKLRDGYWQLDPYVRARSLYDRQGVIRSDGDVNWYRKTDSKSGPSSDLGRE